MKVTYRREMKHNYMIVDPEDMVWQGYECRMIENNVIDGLLRFKTRQSNGEIQFYYEITSRQPLARLLENQTISGEEIRRLVIGISNGLDQIERFLLNESSILLDPDYIYMEPESFRVWLCLVPGLQRDFPDSYGKLLEYILGKVNHQDKDSVVLAYGLYQETRKENYGMEDILRLIRQNPVSDIAGKDFAGKAEEAVWEETAVREETELQAVWGREIPGIIEPEKKPYQGEKMSLWSKLKTFLRERGKKKQTEDTLRHPWQPMFLEEDVGGGDSLVNLPSQYKPPSAFEQSDLRKPSAAPGASATQTKPSAAFKPPTTHKPSAIQKPSSMIGSPAKPQPVKEQESPVLPASDFMPTGQDTILLSDLSPRETVRRLRALDDGETDIVISYYPFIIGKQENLADHILNHETVSRLHLRIDRDETEYKILDLNSTNGTVVRGELLENNESTALYPGDEVQIAKYRYRFE